MASVAGYREIAGVDGSVATMERGLFPFWVRSNEAALQLTPTPPELISSRYDAVSNPPSRRCTLLDPSRIVGRDCISSAPELGRKGKGFGASFSSVGPELCSHRRSEGRPRRITRRTHHAGARASLRWTGTVGVSAGRLRSPRPFLVPLSRGRLSHGQETGGVPSDPLFAPEVEQESDANECHKGHHHRIGVPDL